MSAANITLFFGYLVSAWVAGFAGGLILTYFKRIFEQVA